MKKIVTVLIILVTIFLSAECFAFFSKPKLNERHIIADLIGRKVEGLKFEKFGRVFLRLLDAKYDGDKGTVYVYVKAINPIVRYGIEGKLRLSYEWAADDWNLIELRPIKINKLDKNQTKRLSELVPFPLHFAAAVNDIEGVKKELAKGTEVNSKEGVKGSTALMFAFQLSYIEIAKLLLKKGANINAKNNMGFAPVHAASMSDNINSLELALISGANINEPDNLGFVPLHYAAMISNNKNMVKMLIDRGADPNVKTSKGKTAMDFTSNPEIKRLLKSAGAN